MHTVFSHIVQKRLSQVNEDVATDALSFILHSSEPARNGMIKLLRGIVADMPSLQFRTQQTEGSIRPDMWGFDGADPRVFVENKFWAGFTDQQPVSYLRQLAQYTQPTILLVVVPAAREQAVWRELMRRLENAEISVSYRDTAAGIVQCAATEIGPVLALTSWSRLLSMLELETADDQTARNDLCQLRALCDAADSQAFVPVSAEELSNQRTPAFILQLSTIVRHSVELAATEGVLNLDGLRPQASWDRIGRYLKFVYEGGAGAWFGVRFDLWRQHGGTPLWLLFGPGGFGRGLEMRAILEPWAARKGILSAFENGEFAIGIDLPTGEEKDHVVRSIVDRFREIAGVLDPKNSSPLGTDDADSTALPDELREFIDSSSWTFAKTMPEWPHEYIVRERVDESLFVQLVRHIRANGYEGKFYQKKITYYDNRSLVYWTMGAPIEETTIINRCRKEDTYEYRLLKGTLPQS